MFRVVHPLSTDYIHPQAAAIVGKKWNMSVFLKELFGIIYGLTWM